MFPLIPTGLQTSFERLEVHPLSEAIRQSIWFYAVDQALHLVALAIFAGAVLIVDLRLLGGGARRQPLAQVARDAHPWLVGGFLGLVVTGIPQLMSTATKEFYSPLFWFKMEVLVVATIFTFTIRYAVTRSDEARLGPVWPKVVGLVSIALWLAVAIPARLIGLLS
jgi:hypothetical protein